MIIQNAKVLNCESLRFEQRELYIENGIITDRLPEDRQVLDADGAFVIPGFIDTHIHGFCNCDFGTPTRI